VKTAVDVTIAALYRLTICIRSDDIIRHNTNTLFGLLFGTEANTKRIFGTSLPARHFCSLCTSPPITLGEGSLCWMCWCYTNLHIYMWMKLSSEVLFYFFISFCLQVAPPYYFYPIPDYIFSSLHSVYC